MNRRTVVCVFTLIVVLGLLSTIAPHAYAQTPTPIDQLAVTAVDELPALKKPGVAYLSPDGKWIAYADTRSLCIYTAAGEKTQCAATATGIDRNSIHWSPDSTRVAYTEDFFRLYRDSDIWVMDAATGKLTDLTDDGEFKFSPTAKTNTDTVGYIDVEPHWSSDSKRLLFIRYIQVFGEWQPFVYTIDANGGTPKESGILPVGRFGVYVLAWSPDGKQIAYNRGIERNDPLSGMWIADVDGKNAKQLLSAPLKSAVATPDIQQQARVAIPTNIQFSADGRYLLAADAAGMGAYAARWDEFSSSRVFAVDGSSSSAVDAEEVAHWAAWSPTGTTIVYVARSPLDPNKNGLYVVDKPGAKGRKIYDGPIVIAGETWRPLEWAANNTILVFQTDGAKYQLLHLGLK